jgi:hypothetical protein
MIEPGTCHKIRIFVLFLVFLTVGIALVPRETSAKVVKVEINNREVVSTASERSRSGPYEIIRGIIYLEVDPDDPANQRIVDLILALRNSRGKVEFSTEFELHKPVNADRGNHRLLYFVNNRGDKLGNRHFNRQAGKNWLYGQGWSYLWCGWNCDVIESDRTLDIKVPVATENGKTITGKIYAEMISYGNEITYSQPIVWGGSVAYPPDDMDQSQASLTMRQYRWGEPMEIPRAQWAFAPWKNGQAVPDPDYVYIKQGFKPGWLYDLVYVGKDPKVTGLGLAAIRDVVSFFKHEKADEKGLENPLADMIDYAYAWGHSQSAMLTVKFEGRPGHVVSVKAVVREAPQNFYVFNDNGRDEDELAGDNIWTSRLDVVSDAVPGEYHLDIRAFDKNWNPVFLSGTIKEGRGEIGSIIVTVK